MNYARMNCSARMLVQAGLYISLVLSAPELLSAQESARLIFPEQRRIQVRRPSQLPIARLPKVPPPETVSQKRKPAETWNLTLDEAIRTALADTDVVRVLGGITAVSSGRTIYDPAIANADIDLARSRFDPQLNVTNDFDRTNRPGAVLDGANRTFFGGVHRYGYELGAGATQTNVTGGTAGVHVRANRFETETGEFLPLNPEIGTSADLSYTQPLLQGAGRRVNMAPIVIARINTERSFFQTKNAVQRLVQGVIDAYWALVFARTELWARQQQHAQANFAFDLADKKSAAEMAATGDRAQALSTLRGIEASLVTARANVLQREAALRSMLGLPPSGGPSIVPVTPPETGRLNSDWDEVVALAEQQRPDLIELKLVIEADQQRLLQVRNEARPSVDATALYRWDGLEGRMPDRAYVGTRPGEFTGWALGVNFSVPLGLRASRAALRQQELIIMRDRANLHEGLHEAAHELAATYRDLDQFHEQYQAFKAARIASARNLNFQFVRYQSGAGIGIYLTFLQAMTDWGNRVNSESSSLIQFNTSLARLELQTGTILETHGIRFYEERFASIGPMGRWCSDRCYPRARRPGPNADRYPSGTEPSESIFTGDDPLQRLKNRPPPDTSTPRPGQPTLAPPPPSRPDATVRLTVPEMPVRRNPR